MNLPEPEDIQRRFRRVDARAALQLMKQRSVPGADVLPADLERLLL